MRGRAIFFAAFALRDFFAVYHDIARRLDADANLSAIDCHDRDFDIIANSQSFAGPACQYQHDCIYARSEFVACEYLLLIGVGLRRPWAPARDAWRRAARLPH
jgi:hypothetical protein